MQEEKAYLTRVISSINEQIANYELEIAKQKEEGQLSKFQITDSYYELDQEEMARHKVDLDESEKVVELMQKDKRRLEKQVNRPYFARIDFQSQDEKNKIYIGLGVVRDKDGSLVYDWRAPISSLYYDYDVGPASYSCEEGEISGEITLKRQYAIENQHLKYYIETKETINDEILQEVLSTNTSSKMREIVSTIQKEQNKLIRCDENKNILVQGVAGSGKTSIALHRAGYLLYKNNKFTNRDIFILSPSNLFSNYISNVLPELGEDNVMETPFFTIAKSELDKKLQTRDVYIDDLVTHKSNEKLYASAYKSSFAFIDDLTHFLENVYMKTFRTQTLSFSTPDSKEPLFVFTKEEMEQLYYETYKDLPVYKRISYMAEYLVERFNLRKREFLPVKERFQKFLYNFFPSTDLQTILNLFYSVHKIEANKTGIYNYDDIPAILIIKDYMFGLKINIPTKYLIIDEVQDFTPAHFYLINKLWDCPKLLLGDINQCIEKNLTPEYLDMLSEYLGAEKIVLNKTYRSTKEISEFCQKIIGLKDVQNMCRSGEKPDIIKTKDQIESIKELLLENAGKFKHIAIVCKSTTEATQLYNELSRDVDIHMVQDSDSSFDYKFIITTATTSKGIEFDYVIIPNVEKSNYRDNLDKNLLYIAGTRALHKLSLLFTEELSKLIK